MKPKRSLSIEINFVADKSNWDQIFVILDDFLSDDNKKHEYGEYERISETVPAGIGGGAQFKH